jgi:hypothetical protein
MMAISVTFIVIVVLQIRGIEETLNLRQLVGAQKHARSKILGYTIIGRAASSLRGNRQFTVV